MIYNLSVSIAISTYYVLHNSFKLQLLPSRHKITYNVSSTGEEYLKLKPKSKPEDVSEYFTFLCDDCVQKGYQKLSIILDNNSTHKAKMQAQLQAHLFDLNIQDKIHV